MQDFDEVMKEYGTKIVDAENPQKYSYDLTIKIKRQVIDIRDPLQRKELPPNCTKAKGVQGTNKRVMTPNGLFDSIREAAEHYNISGSSVSYRCSHWTPHNFFYYED